MKARIAGPSIFRPLWRRDFSSSASRRAINKIVPSAKDAIKDLKGSSMILVGGFGFSGVPTSLINAVRDRPELKDFTVVSNNAGMPGVGLGECFAFALKFETRELIILINFRVKQVNYLSLVRSAR
jgi:3-oxoacid CoA-transferase